jgi:hypothetical protein
MKRAMKIEGEKMLGKERGKGDEEHTILFTLIILVIV